jgi:hypothetical protein
VKDYGASADVEVKFFQLIGEQHVEQIDHAEG